MFASILKLIGKIYATLTGLILMSVFAAFVIFAGLIVFVKIVIPG